jgi:hypothetical protein
MNLRELFRSGKQKNELLPPVTDEGFHSSEDLFFGSPSTGEVDGVPNVPYYFLFQYPRVSLVRKHGPSYSSYASFRPWIRDDFSYRCAYCLIRETLQTDPFELEHIEPQISSVGKINNYNNLVYSCRRCNGIKNSDPIPGSPEIFLVHDNIEVNEDGEVVSKTELGRAFIEIVVLDDEQLTSFRSRLIRTMKTLYSIDIALYIEYMGYPDDICDLAGLRPASNSKPEGIKESAYYKREESTLPVVYE